MHENLFAIITIDKTVALMKIEPLDYAGLAFCHNLYTFLAFILERSKDMLDQLLCISMI